MVLEKLGRYSGRPFADQWDFAAWAEKHAPERDLRSPLRYLLGKTKLEKEFEHLALVSPALAPGNVLLRGTPRSLGDRVQQVELEINQESQIARILIEGTDGSTTEFRFNGLVENPGLGDALFRFAPPAGVQVIEGEELAQ